MTDLARHLHRLVGVMAVPALLVGCEHDLPPARAGGIVEGTVAYEGAAHQELAQPALLIAAFPEFPPTSSFPNSLLIIENPDFSQGPIPFRLQHLQAFDWYVVAQLAEVDALGAVASTLGGFPDFCTLSSSESGPVRVTDEAPTTGIDLQMYDGSGLLDPCNAPTTDFCPDEGKGSFVLTVERASQLESTDQILVVMYDQAVDPGDFMSGLLLDTAVILPADEAIFPVVYIQNGLATGQYAAAVCFDLNSDFLSTFDCTMGGDQFHLYEEGLLFDVTAGSVTRGSLSLDDGTTTDPATETADAAGCP